MLSDITNRTGFFFYVLLDRAPDNKEYFAPYLGRNSEGTDLFLQKLTTALLKNAKTDAILQLLRREPGDEFQNLDPISSTQWYVPSVETLGSFRFQDEDENEYDI